MGLALAAAPGCGGKDAAKPDAVPIPDAAADAAPDAGPTQITVKAYPDGFPYLGRTANATLVAFQDGDGPWVSLTGTAGVYHATVTGQRYSVAVGCVVGYGSTVELFYQTVADTAEVRADGCPTTAGTVHLTVNLLGLNSGDRTDVWFGSTVGAGIAGTPIEVDVPKGTVDVFARSHVAMAGPIVPTKLFRGPTVNVQADQVLQYDVGTLGKALESHALTLSGLDPAESVQVHSSYATPYSQVQWPLLTKSFPGAPDSYVTIDASIRQAGDISNITATAQRTAGGLTYERRVRQAFATPAAQTLALPAAWTADAPTVQSAALSQVTVTIPITPATQTVSDYTVSLSTDATATITSRTLTLLVKSGWAKGPSSVTIATPDLTQLPGWTAELALTSGVPVNWSIERDDRNAPYDALPSDGRHTLTTRVSGQLAP